MKLYVILHQASGKVVAISEEKKNVVTYMLEKNFSEQDYMYVKITKEKHFNSLMWQYDDLYLEHDKDLDMVLTRVELQMINDVIGEEKGRINSTIFELEHFLKNYRFSKKEASILFKALKILEASKKKKKLKKVIDLETFIGFVKKSKNIADVFRDKLHETADKLFVFINLKD